MEPFCPLFRSEGSICTAKVEYFSIRGKYYFIFFAILSFIVLFATFCGIGRASGGGKCASRAADFSASRLLGGDFSGRLCCAAGRRLGGAGEEEPERESGRSVRSGAAQMLFRGTVAEGPVSGAVERGRFRAGRGAPCFRETAAQMHVSGERPEGAHGAMRGADGLPGAFRAVGRPKRGL